ncbi:MAG: hypothetical protein ACAH88_17140 [Roseimicrobium sp.]
MGKKKGFFLPAIAALAVLVAGLALVVFLPLPEERAWWGHVELSRIKIKSVRWENITPRKAVEELNQEIQKAGCTRYRLILAEGANDPVFLTEEVLEGDDIPLTEVVRYVVELTGNRTFLSPKGIVIERLDIDPKEAEELYPFADAHEVPSWRRNLREWVESKLPWRLPRWFEPEALSEYYSQDPFAPSPSMRAMPPSETGPSEDPSAPVSGQSPRDPFAPTPSK